MYGIDSLHEINLWPQVPLIIQENSDCGHIGEISVGI